MDKKKKTKAAMIFFGVIAGLICCEFVLHVSSFFIQGNINTVNFSDKNNIRILCLGDSFTFGAGAKLEFSYPAQLQRILDENKSKRRFEVMNLGYPGKNSALLAQELPQIIKSYMPDIVLVMIGVNDYSNFQGLDNNLIVNNFAQLGFLSDFKIVKLFQITYLNLKTYFSPVEKANFRQKIFGYFSLIIEAAEQRHQGNFNKAELLCKKAVAEFSELGLGYLELARVYQDKVSFSQALNIFKKAAGMVVSEEELPVFSGLIELSRRAEEAEQYDISIRALAIARCLSLDNEQVYAEFDHIFSVTEDPQKAVIVYKFLNETFPEDTQIILRLARMYKAMRDFEEAKKYWTVLLENKNFQREAGEGVASSDFFIKRGVSVVLNSTGEYGFSNFLNEIAVLQRHSVREEGNYISKNQLILLKNENKLAQNYFNTVFIKEIESIILTCNNAGVKLFFVSYPLLVQPYVSAEAKRRKLDFIDLRPEFLKVLEKGHWNDFFVHDGHCTAQGYEIIAGSVASAILNQFK